MRQGVGSHVHDNEPHAVYRVLGEYMRVIYIGASHDPSARVEVHRTTATWGHEIARWEIIAWHENLAAARPAERTAIRAEDPDHNFQHTESALIVARASMKDRRRVNAEVRRARRDRIAMGRMDAAIRAAS